MDRLCKYEHEGPRSWEQDLGPFLRFGGDTMFKFEKMLQRVPRIPVRIPPPPKPICRRSERCEGCPYPGHGFICWGSDGGCLRSEMEKICAPKEMMTQWDSM